MPLPVECFYGQGDGLAQLLAPFASDLDPEIDEPDAAVLDAELRRLERDDLMVAMSPTGSAG